jgi:4-coumarate--CoA ligase
VERGGATRAYHWRHGGVRVTERTITYAQLLLLAQKLCAGLAANGLKKGDVRTCSWKRTAAMRVTHALCPPTQIVILHSINCIEYPVVFLALNRLGAICSPSSPQFTARELADQIEAAQVRTLIALEKMNK